MRPAALAAALLVASVSCGSREISDAELLRYAASTYDKRKMEGREIIVGVHRGVQVVAEFPCADLCPDYTTRVIRYAVAPGAECASKGGVDKLIGVPEGIGWTERRYCVPAILAANWEQYRR